MSNRFRNSNQYKVLAAAVVKRAKLNGLPCYRCGVPLRPGDRVDADHVIPLADAPHLVLDPSNLRASHASCNRSHGATMGNLRRGRLLFTSREW